MFLVLKRILIRLITRQYCEVYYINGPDNLPAPLSREQEAAVFLRLEEGDPKAKETLITHNLRLVVYIARKFESTGIGIEDLEVECNSLRALVNNLGEREQRIMRLRFGLDGGRERTQKEVADIIGISQSYISRLEKKIIRQLREEMQRVY